MTCGEANRMSNANKGSGGMLSVALLVISAVALGNCLVFPIFGSESNHTLTSYGSISYLLPIETQMLRGCDKIGFEYVNPAIEIYREVDPAYYDYDAQQIASWNASFVRVPFNSYWYNNDPLYREYLRQQVDAFSSKGLYVDLDLHSHGSPPTQGPYGGWTEEQCWSLFYTDFLPTLERVSRDYLNQSHMIGVEINEFWGMDDKPGFWTFTMRMGNTLAQRIHTINPNLLIFIDTYGEWCSDSEIQAGVTLLTEPKIVFAPHFYCAETLSGLVLHPIKPCKYGETDGWDFYYAYESGNLTLGKSKMYHWLDIYYKAIQNLYNIPFVIDEFSASDQPNIIQALQDMIDYFKAQNWGFSYLGYYGQDTPSLHLLYGDWQRLMPQGETLVAELRGS